MVGNDHLVHAQKLVGSHKFGTLNIQVGFFLHLAGNAFLRRLTCLHEAGDQCIHFLLPGRIARQQHLAIHLHDGSQHGRGVVPVRPPASRAAQARLVTPVFQLGDPGKGRATVGAVAGFILGHGRFQKIADCAYPSSARAIFHSKFKPQRTRPYQDGLSLLQAGNTPVER